MTEKHFAYKITKNAADLVCQHEEFEEDKMLELLKDIQQLPPKGIYWIFKQIDGKPQEALAIIDCAHQRIYYHYSGEVEDINETINKLSQSI